MEVRIRMVKSLRYLEWPFGLQNFVNTLKSKSSHELTPCLIHNFVRLPIGRLRNKGKRTHLSSGASLKFSIGCRIKVASKRGEDIKAFVTQTPSSLTKWPKWHKIIQNDPKQHKMTQNIPKCPKMTKNDPNIFSTIRYFCPLFSTSVRFSGAVPVFPSYSRKNGKKVEWRNDCRLSGMTDTPGAVIRHHLMPFGCRLVIPPSFQTQIWIAFFCHSSSIDEADMPPNDDDFHSEAIPPVTHGRGPFRRSSSFHETKLHPNDGHFHLVVNPSAIQGKGSLSPFLVIPRDQTASKWRRFSFQGNSTGDPREGRKATKRRQYSFLGNSWSRRAPFSSKSPNSGGLCPNPIEKCSKRRNDTRSEIGCHFKLER